MIWPTVPLKEIAPAQTPNIRFSADEQVWHLTLDQIESHTGDIVNKKIAPASTAGTSTNVFDDGNVLYSKLRPYLNKVICPTEPGIATTELVPLRPRQDLLDRRYIAYYLRSNHFLGFANVAVAGVKMPRIMMAKFWNHRVPLPPLSEQRRIVEIIDQADTLRRRRAEADVKAARILPALFYRMFGDPTTNMNTEKWPLRRIDAVADVSYGLPDRLDSALTAEQGTRIITISNVTIDGQIDTSVERLTPADDTMLKKASVHHDDLLFNWRNGSKQHIGKTAIWEDNWSGDVLHVSFLLRIRPKKEHIEPYYLWALINLLRAGGFFIAKSRMQINSKFNASELSALQIPVPPPELQLIFARQLRILRSITGKNIAAGRKISALFDVLLHRAFIGDLTAKWREAHMGELLSEMEAQAKALEFPPTKVNPPEVGSKRHAGHDMFNKAALAAYITERCHAPDSPMGRVKLAKLFYLVQQKAEIELTQTFMKRAAGPLDDEIHKFLSLAQKSKWLVLCRGEGDLKPVKPGANVSKAIEQAQKLLGPAKAKVDEMLDQMKGWGYRAFERWATVLDASFELTAAGQSATVEGVKDVIQKHPEWVPKLNRDEFSDTNIEAALKGLRGFGFITNHD